MVENCSNGLFAQSPCACIESDCLFGGVGTLPVIDISVVVALLLLPIVSVDTNIISSSWSDCLCHSWDMHRLQITFVALSYSYSITQTASHHTKAKTTFTNKCRRRIVKWMFRAIWMCYSFSDPLKLSNDHPNRLSLSLSRHLFPSIWVYSVSLCLSLSVSLISNNVASCDNVTNITIDLKLN